MRKRTPAFSEGSSVDYNSSSCNRRKTGRRQFFFLSRHGVSSSPETVCTDSRGFQTNDESNPNARCASFFQGGKKCHNFRPVPLRKGTGGCHTEELSGGVLARKTLPQKAALGESATLRLTEKSETSNSHRIAIPSGAQKRNYYWRRRGEIRERIKLPA